MSIPILKTGISAFYDSMRDGLVQVKVLEVRAPAKKPTFELRSGLAPVSVKVKAQVTKTQGSYPKGHVIDTNAVHVVPKGAVRRHKHSTTIGLYSVEADPVARTNPPRAKASYKINLIHPKYLNISLIQFALAEAFLGNLKLRNYERSMTQLIDEMQKRTGERYGRVKDLDPLVHWHASLTGAERMRLRKQLKEKDADKKIRGVALRNPSTKHRRGSLTHARSQAKAKLHGMPIGSRAVVGHWLDTNTYEAKFGGGMSWAHERFRPVEVWVVAVGRGGRTKLEKWSITM
jgi:hypothetical protein